MISSGRTAIGTVATLIDGTSNSSYRLIVHNDDNADDVWLGNSTVTSTTGLTLNKLETIDLLLPASSELYAVAGKTGHQITWMRIT